MIPRVVLVLVLVLVLLLGCGSSGSFNAATDLGARVATAAVGAAASGSGPRRDSYEYRVAVTRAKTQCASAGANGRVRLVVTDGASHLAIRPSDDVRFVRYDDCQLEWLDGCAARDPSTYSARWTIAPSEGARILDIADEADLYERLPGASLPLVARSQRGARLRVEVIGATMRETQLSWRRRDLVASDVCALATHWVAAIEQGALRLNVDPSPSPSERELDAQKELELGSYAACRRGEPDACEAPVAVTLAPIPRAAAE